MWLINSTYHDYECYLKQRDFQIDKELLEDYTNSNGLSYELTPDDIGYDDNFMIPFVSSANKEVNIFIQPSEEYKEYIDAMLEAHSDDAEYKLKIDPNKCEVTCIEVESYIYGLTFSDSDGSKRCIILRQPDYKKQYDEEKFYSLALFDRAIDFLNMDYVEYIATVIPKFGELLSFVNETLYPVLKKADYKCDSIKMNKPVVEFENIDEYFEEFSIVFEHPSDRYRSSVPFWIQLDPLTFEIYVVNDLDIFNKNKDELYDYLLENYWKKSDTDDVSNISDNIPLPFSYLYRDNENVESFSNYMDESIKRSHSYYYKNNKIDELNKLEDE